MASSTEDFYLRYYVGHKGKFGHEFLEFEFRPDGKLRYANNSNYKNDTMIRKEAYVHQSVMEELKRIIVDSEIMQEDDSLWPPPDRVGRQVCVYRESENAVMCGDFVYGVHCVQWSCSYESVCFVHSTGVQNSRIFNKPVVRLTGSIQDLFLIEISSITLSAFIIVPFKYF